MRLFCVRNFILPTKEKKKSLLYFYAHSETLRTKCFVSLWAELYEGEIFQIIVVRLLLLVLARALNSRSIALYKKNGQASSTTDKNRIKTFARARIKQDTNRARFIVQ